MIMSYVNTEEKSYWAVVSEYFRKKISIMRSVKAGDIGTKWRVWKWSEVNIPSYHVSSEWAGGAAPDRGL
jgi:hypothetical protein